LHDKFIYERKFTSYAISKRKKKAMILTGILSGYLSLIRADSACLLSALQDGDFWLTKAREVKQQQLDLSEI